MHNQDDEKLSGAQPEGAQQPVQTPAGDAGELAADQGELEELDASEAAEGEAAESRRPPQFRRDGFSSGAEFLTSEIPLRAQHSNPRLRANLVGSVLVRLTNTNQRFLFDWSSEQLSTGMIAGGAPEKQPDCTINLSDGNLLRVVSGDLNPQIAMLSDKIQVEGRLSLAVYFFNLVAPRSQN